LCESLAIDLAITSYADSHVSVHGRTVWGRLISATHHLTAQTDWGKAMFMDETSVWFCNDHRWLWRKPGSNREDLRHQKTKFTKKAMMFTGIAKKWRTPIVTIEGAIDAFIYCDDCIDTTGLIPGMIGSWCKMARLVTPQRKPRRISVSTPQCSRIGRQDLQTSIQLRISEVSSNGGSRNSVLIPLAKLLRWCSKSGSHSNNFLLIL
jgi:hypothetical protein